MPKDLQTLAKRYALQNAVHHGGEARADSVLGKMLAAEPELRKKVQEARGVVDEVVDEVNALSVEEQKKLLEKLEEPLVPEKKEKEGLPSLPSAERKKVILRFAPNPDGALHLGNARPAIISDEYAKRYGGKLILRFDDTDPKVKVPEKRFYKWIREDLKWLGIIIQREFIASKRLKIYEKYADEAVKIGAAYVCTCSGESWKKKRDEGEACGCRDLAKKSNAERWNKMKKGSYKEGKAVLRVKTDMQDKNPAVRDWPAFRIVDKPAHPFSKAKIWPLFNFASAIDDHLLGITHIIRGQEHATNEAKQRYLYKAFGWHYPHVKILGRLSLQGMVMSKSLIREGILQKNFAGWDDPRLATLQSLRRRGFQPDALRRLIVSIGATSSDSAVAFENLAAYNRKIIDAEAKRFFFIENPAKITLDKVPVREAKLRLHPEVDMGFRKIKAEGKIFVEKGDLERFSGSEVRLMGFCNVVLEERAKVTGTENKSIQRIHWVPAGDNIKVNVIMPEGTLSGFGEPGIAKLAKKNEVIQFERFGFCRLERISKSKVTAVFTHR
ncbi:MAG: glutamate--tRNA ligase [Candidatus Aenigmarchaeota archaeon]|nr:glutamate--tRNA ligase [Candidatus Aenigmarchaeota archaeon]